MSYGSPGRDEIDEIDVLLESQAQPRTVRGLPALIRSSFALVRESAPSRFNALIALQLASAGLSALLVYLGKLALDELLDTSDAGSLSHALPLLLAVV
ncbi:MAG: hypothetical protein ABIM89_04390, partial [Mycobacteriales bacterium]